MNENYRFYCESLSASPVELSTAESHHAMHVLRLAAGAEVELFDGRGGRAAARILQAKHGKVSAELTGPVQSQPRPAPVLQLAFAEPKGKRLDWLLEKATELGAASLQPLIFERSVSGGELSVAKRDRWLVHCISAAKQCGLDFLPEVAEPVALDKWLADLSRVQTADSLHTLQKPQERGQDARDTQERPVRLVGDLSEQAISLPTALKDWRREQPVTLVVGPEGGLTVRELNSLRAAGFTGVRLGHTTLRIETAAIALLAAVTALK